MRTQVKLLFRDRIHFSNNITTSGVLMSIELCFDDAYYPVWDFRYYQYKDLNFL